MDIKRIYIFDAVKALRGGQAFTPAEVGALDAAIDKALGISAQPHALSDTAGFFRIVRQAFGPLRQAQVEGFGVLLVAFGAARWPLSWAAYGLATAWHETNNEMVPVREAYWLSEDWRRTHLRYYPHYGRGYCQLTWPKNYERADEELGLKGALVADPDLALKPEIAAQIMVRGMEGGWFTGKRLADYLPLAGDGGFDAFKLSRMIINGTDQAEKIAKEAVAFQSGLGAGGWQ